MSGRARTDSEAATSRARSDSALPPMLEALPIFPLPNCVLLPGGLLPLHVFEDRYRALTRDCLAGDHLMAIARLRPDALVDDTGQPGVFAYAGVGRIIASDELPDGRFMLLLRGVGRVAIDAELPRAGSYRRVRARAVADADAPDRARFAAAYESLRALCDRLALALDQCGDGGGAQLRELARCASAPGRCADAVAAALIMDVDERQRLLETRCPQARLDLTIGAVSQLLCALAPCDGDMN
ncbi:MAG: LON peptidase substrate-binding domain-containing protein [Kofleriaceae bacterium]